MNGNEQTTTCALVADAIMFAPIGDHLSSNWVQMKSVEIKFDVGQISKNSRRENSLPDLGGLWSPRANRMSSHPFDPPKGIVCNTCRE